MRLLIKEIVQETGSLVTFTNSAYEALQTAVEDYITQTFEDANVIALTGKRSYVKPDDIRVVRRKLR